MILALPGVLFGRVSWEPLQQVLPVTPHTFPGYDGRPRLPQYTPSPEDYADDIARGLTTPVRVLAHCSGCAPALALATKYPHLVEDLTLVAYWHGTKEWESRKDGLSDVWSYAMKRAPLLVSVAECPPCLYSKIAYFIADAVKDPEGMLQMARSMAAYSARPYLRRVSCPVTFIVGTQDQVTMPDAQLKVAADHRFPVHTIPVGHCPHIEDPDAFSQVYARAGNQPRMM